MKGRRESARELEKENENQSRREDNVEHILKK